MKGVSRVYHLTMLAAIIIGVLPLMFRGEAPWMIYADWFSCSLFVIDYLLRWYDAFAHRPVNRLRAFVSYPFRLMAILDLLSILPTFSALNASFKLFRMARLLRILRIFRIIRYYPPLQMMLNVLRRERATLFTVFTFALFYIFVTALIMFNAEVEFDPATGEPVFETFFDAVYWSACTLTTVGYGDICPVSWVGRLISMLSAIMGVAIIALPSGIITAAYLDELKEWKSRKKS